MQLIRPIRNKPDEYILAIVEVDGVQTKTVYLKKPFSERPDFAATSVNFDIIDLVNESSVIFNGGSSCDN